MNLQYPDTLHLVISASTTSFHFLLQFSSPILSFRFLSFILLSPIPLFRIPSHLSFCLPSSLPSSLFPINPTNTLKNKDHTTMRLLQTEGYSRLFSSSPLVSVSHSFAEHSESKSDTGHSLLQTAGGQHLSVKPVP